MSDATKYYVRLDSSGVWHRVREEWEPIDGEKLLSKLATASGRLLPLIGPDTYAYLLDNYTFVTELFDTLVYKALVGVVSKTTPEGTQLTFRPTFSRDCGVRADKPLLLKAPEGMLWAFTSLLDGAEFRFSVVCPRTNSIFCPPVPNVYPSLTVCTGLATYPLYSPKAGLSAYLKQCKDLFTQQEWNGDLKPSAANKISFDYDTGASFPVWTHEADLSRFDPDQNASYVEMIAAIMDARRKGDTP